jgi:hypothetical protein
MTVSPQSHQTSVYAHSSAKLYRIDPVKLTVTLVGPFGWPGNPDAMTDLAIDRSGRVIGISFDHVYAVDPKTAKCTHLAKLTQDFNGLSFITNPGGGNERLLATAADGTVFEIDPQNGHSKKVGSYGANLTSSGDLVSVKGIGTVATVKKDALGGDWLARVNPATGHATLIGPTGYTNIWGLGFWKDKVYGFTESSMFVLIDVKTGGAKLVSSGGGPWWGAAVTTSAPVQ